MVHRMYRTQKDVPALEPAAAAEAPSGLTSSQGRQKRSLAAKRMLVRNETSNKVLATSADIADNAEKRRRGLLGRDCFALGQGLWIVPCEAVHTCFMKFRIDVLYLDHKKRVLALRRTMAPWRISCCLTAHSVLEVPAGAIEQTETQVGDQLAFLLLD
jgi:uncharacterized membrane protein (UPF0127 family)